MAGSSARRRRAASGNEYALLIGLIAVIGLAAVGGLGMNVKTLFGSVSNRLVNAESGVGGGTGTGGGGTAADTRTTCKTLLAGGSAANGTYTIDPDGTGGAAPFDAVCDMSGGGWTQLVKSSPANTHPAWTANAAYNVPSASSHISIGWFTMANFTEVRMADVGNPGTYYGGAVSGCWTNETMHAQTLKSTWTCTTSAVAGVNPSPFSFNVSQTFNSCALSARMSRQFGTWDAGVSGSYYGLANGYRTNNTINCGSQCVLYSASCLPAGYNGGGGYGVDIWVR